MVTKPYFDPVQIGDEIFDLSHLNPFTLNAESVAAKKNLRVRVIFSDHCFTKSCDSSCVPKGEPVFPNSGNKVRVFCRVRHGLSFALPDLIRKLNHPKIKVFETAA